MSAHLDFKREGLGWLVWCRGEWQIVYIAGESVICDGCAAEISHRLKVPA